MLDSPESNSSFHAKFVVSDRNCLLIADLHFLSHSSVFCPSDKIGSKLSNFILCVWYELDCLVFYKYFFGQYLLSVIFSIWVFWFESSLTKVLLRVIAK